MYRLLLLLLLFFPSIGFCQDPHIDQEKVDSLKQQIDHRNQQIRSEQDSFKKNQDSIYYAQMDKRIAKSIRDNFDYNRQLEEQHRRQVYIRIGVGIVFLVLLVLGLIRRRKKPLT
ncbi:MAG TPA: hypothetical protein VNS32_20730 [Flavisolibacter sp.]|nr:hypothetical protein [Flavisolibacter sp.]